LANLGRIRFGCLLGVDGPAEAGHDDAQRKDEQRCGDHSDFDHVSRLLLMRGVNPTLEAVFLVTQKTRLPRYPEDGI
jgi:hypothetical protein